MKSGDKELCSLCCFAADKGKISSVQGFEALK